MAVTLAESPLTCVAIGSGLALEHFDELNTNGTTRHAVVPLGYGSPAPRGSQ